MLKLTDLRHLILGTAVSSVLFAASASAQIPSDIDVLWKEDFQEYSAGEALATPATYDTSTQKWRLSAGNDARFPAAVGLRAAAGSEGNIYGAITSPWISPTNATPPGPGHPSGNMARIFSHSDFSTITWDRSANLLFGGDMIAMASGNTASNSTARYIFTGRTDEDTVFGVTLAIDSNRQFTVSYNNLEPAVNSGELLASTSSWYGFAAEVDSETNVITVSVYDLADSVTNPIWSTSSAGAFAISTITQVEMAVRHGRNDRIAGFDNVYIGTAAIPEPTTTAAFMLLAVGALVVYKRRRRG